MNNFNVIGGVDGNPNNGRPYAIGQSRQSLRFPLIVGIDPGTTTGLCILDLEGNIVSMISMKSFPRSAMANFIKAHGCPVIIASDICPPPRSIEKAAASYSARLLYPNHRISKPEKKSVVDKYVRKRSINRPWSNTHEKDALYAALHAWNEIRDLMCRIDNRLGELPDIGLHDRVRKGVIADHENIMRSIRRVYGKVD